MRFQRFKCDVLRWRFIDVCLKWSRFAGGLVINLHYEMGKWQTVSKGQKTSSCRNISKYFFSSWFLLWFSQSQLSETQKEEEEEVVK